MFPLTTSIVLWAIKKTTKTLWNGQQMYHTPVSKLFRYCGAFSNYVDQTLPICPHAYPGWHPILNTQSCNKGAFGPKSFGGTRFLFLGHFWQPGQYIKKHCSVCTKELHNELHIILFHLFIFFLGSAVCTFSNVNVLNKGFLLQDWVFRLGLTSAREFFYCSVIREDTYLYNRNCQRR